MNAFRSALYALIFYVGSVPLVLTGLAAFAFGQRSVIAVARAWAKFHAWCSRWLLGIHTRVIGTLPQSDAIIAFKHEAMFEAIEVLRLFERPAVVFKAELLSIPLWSTVALRHGVIPVARETGSSALRKMLTAARVAVAAGRPIVIFPEGTRVPAGERAPLRPGIAGLYKSLALPIIPVAVNSGRLWRRKGAKLAGVVTMKVGETIPPGLSREDVERRVWEAINALNH